MPTSIRLDPELEARLRAIADSEGVALSEVLRRAAHRYLNEMGGSLRVRLADAIGTVRSRGGRARRTGESFKRLVRRRS
jgi:predicted DNA-binding protein